MEKRGLQLENGRCRFCTSVAVNVCDRCGDYYCSIQCQTSDWPLHKYVCIPMPCLVPATRYARPVVKAELFDLQHNAAEPMLEIQKSQHAPAIKSEKIMQHPQMPELYRHIIIVGFRSANRCTIIDFKDKTEYTDVFYTIDIFGKTASTLQAIPKPLTHAIAKFEGRFCRVQVLSVSEDGRLKVFFNDLGITAKRNLSELREISDEIKQLPRYCEEVALCNVKNYVLTEKLKTFLYSLKNQEYKLCYEQESGVELYDLNTSESLSEKIARMFVDTETYSNNNFIVGTDNKQANSQFKQNVQPDIIANGKAQTKNPATDKETDANFSSVTETKNKQTQSLGKEQVRPDIVADKEVQPKYEVIKSAEPVVKDRLERDLGVQPPFQMCLLAVGKTNEEVIVVDNSSLNKGYIGVIPPNALHNVAKVQEYLYAYEDTQQPYEPNLLEYCIAKFNGDWYRAKVLEIINETIFLIIYIDFSNVGVVEADDIRRYPSDLNLDCLTNLCLIDGLPKKLTEKQLEFLENEMPIQSKLIIDKIIGCEDDVVEIQCASIIQKLRSLKI